MDLRSSLLAATASRSIQPLVLSEAWTASSAEAALQVLTPEQREATLQQLDAELQDVVSRCLLGSAPTEDSENVPPVDEATKDAASPILFLSRATGLLFAFAEDKAQALPPSFLAVAQTLHGSLFYIPEDRDGLALQRDICRLCERLWTQERSGRESVVSYTLALLLIRSLEESASDASIKRLWALRDAVTWFDLTDPENGNLRELLVRCFASASFLRTADNRRMLAHILAACPPLVADVAAVIRDTLPAAKARVVDGLGEVVFKAWAGCTGAARMGLETLLLQDIAVKGLHARHAATFGAVRGFLLSALAERKRAKGVDALLARIYRPILFRALESDSAPLRRNAAVLLLDSFPLRDPDSGAGGSSDGDGLLQRQFTALGNLLIDASPGVREVGVSGVAKVLATYWEVIPGPAAAILLERLVNDCAADVRAPGVRASVPAALRFLLESQVLSHPALAMILPGYLENALNDRSDKVRAATAQLLVAISGVRTLLPRLFDGFISVDALLARLTLDQLIPPVAEPLTQVLVHSYFPAEATNTALWLRTARSLQDQEAATLAFFAVAHTHVPVASLIKHMLILRTALKKSLLTGAAAATAAATVLKEEEALAAMTAAMLSTAEEEGGSAAEEEEAGAPSDAAPGPGATAETNGPATVVTEEEDAEEEEDDGFNNNRRRRRRKARAAGGAKKAPVVSAPKPQAPAAPVETATTVAGGGGSSGPLNTRLLAGVCRVIATIWTTIAPALEAPPPSSDDPPATEGEAPEGLVDPVAEGRKRLEAAFSGEELGILMEGLWPASSPTGSSPLPASAAAEIEARCVAVSSLFAIAALLPPGATHEGLRGTLWGKLFSMAPASAPLLQHTLSFLCSRGEGDGLLGAASEALKPLDPSAAAPSPSAGMHPTIALSVMVGVLNLASAPGGGVAVSADALAAAMAALTTASHRIVPCLLRITPPQQQGQGGESAALPPSAPSSSLGSGSPPLDPAHCALASIAWAKLLLHGTSIIAVSGAVPFAAAFAHRSGAHAMAWIRGALLPAAVAAADAAAAGAGAASSAASHRTQAAASAVFSTLTEAVADLLLLSRAPPGSKAPPQGSRLPPPEAGGGAAGVYCSPRDALAMFAACTSGDAMPISSASGSGDHGAVGQFSTTTPLDWTCAPSSPLPFTHAAGVGRGGGGGIPRPAAAALRLGLAVHRVGVPTPWGDGGGVPFSPAERSRLWQGIARLMVSVCPSAPPPHAAAAAFPSEESGSLMTQGTAGAFPSSSSTPADTADSSYQPPRGRRAASSPSASGPPAAAPPSTQAAAEGAATEQQEEEEARAMLDCTWEALLAPFSTSAPPAGTPQLRQLRDSLLIEMLTTMLPELEAAVPPHAPALQDAPRAAAASGGVALYCPPLTSMVWAVARGCASASLPSASTALGQALATRLLQVKAAAGLRLGAGEEMDDDAEGLVAASSGPVSREGAAVIQAVGAAFCSAATRAPRGAVAEVRAILAAMS